MNDWRDLHDGQNLRMANKMLEQQGEIADLKTEIERLNTELAALREGRRAVLDLHEPFGPALGYCGGCSSFSVAVAWPCTTVRALGGPTDLPPTSMEGTPE